MIKYILGFVFSISFVSSAFAYLPDGCYATDATGNCWEVFFTPSDCDQYMTFASVGIYMTSACQYVNDRENAVADWNAAFNIAIQQRDYNYNGWAQCTTSLNTATATAFNVDNALKAQIALVKKLRKACGSKCKRIR
jgi:hypothetical protein